MFSGIIAALGIVKKITFSNIYSIDIEIKKITLDEFEDLNNPIKIGSSIACSGVCLTVKDRKNKILTFDVSQETMRKTNLSEWREGKIVNLERALKVGDEIGGHYVSGHVDTILKVQKIQQEQGSNILFIKLNKEISPFIASKGSITLEGISLTVNDVTDDFFNVNIIPFTWNNTNLFYIKANESLNVEIDLLARYLVNYQKRKFNEDENIKN